MFVCRYKDKEMNYVLQVIDDGKCLKMSTILKEYHLSWNVL